MGLKKDVRKAAEVLDNLRPKWYKKVKIKKLDMLDTELCVLGQVFAKDTKHSGYDGYAFGVDYVPGGEKRAFYWVKAKKYWIKEIKARR